jgi:type II secretory pathway component PulM
MNKKTILASVIISLLIGLMAGCAGPQFDHQPRMDAALDELRAARQELERAAPNKGGHREKAIELIDRAINQVKEGVEFGERYVR